MAIIENRRNAVSWRPAALLVAVTLMSAVCGCSSSDSKTYDISPIFPLTANKCAKYDGKSEGSGFAAKCLVTRDKCEQAVQDWRNATRSVGDAIQFRCD